jgi:hypothetical protein
MVLLNIILIIIILGGAIYNSRRERFTCKNRYKRVRVDDNGKNTYKFLTNVKISDYKIYDFETELKCRYKQQKLCGNEESRDCLIYRNDGILRCSTSIDMTTNAICYCDEDCCSNICINNKCADKMKPAFDVYGYKPSNRKKCPKK